MPVKILILVATFLSMSAFTRAIAQSKPILANKNQLAELLKQPSNKHLVINFWATWCKPCVRELPYFLAADSAYSARNVHVILISLDFDTDLETKLVPFLQRKGIHTEVWLMRDLNYNDWMPLVSSDWDGAIPATLLVSADRQEKTFFSGELSQKTLFKKIEQLLKEHSD